MNRYKLNCCKYLGLSLLIVSYVCNRVEAQITTDSTTNTSLETTDSQITINDGDRAQNFSLVLLDLSNAEDLAKIPELIPELSLF